MIVRLTWPTIYSIHAPHNQWELDLQSFDDITSIHVLLSSEYFHVYKLITRIANVSELELSRLAPIEHITVNQLSLSPQFRRICLRQLRSGVCNRMRAHCCIAKKEDCESSLFFGMSGK